MEQGAMLSIIHNLNLSQLDHITLKKSLQHLFTYGAYLNIFINLFILNVILKIDYHYMSTNIWMLYNK